MLSIYTVLFKVVYQVSYAVVLYVGVAGEIYQLKKVPATLKRFQDWIKVAFVNPTSREL